MYISVMKFIHLSEILFFVFIIIFLFSREARELYSVQFEQLGRKLQLLEILVPIERILAFKDARSKRVNGIWG